jgi:hypothetical protein
MNRGGKGWERWIEEIIIMRGCGGVLFEKMN